MNKGIFISLVIVVAITTTIFLINYTQLQAPMNEVISSDHRNSGIEVSVYYNHYVSFGALRYDLQLVSANNSRADVFRVLLQFASEMKSQEFEVVELAFNGETKFYLEGAYFEQLGREYGTQNPMYTMRTFPEHIKLPDGSMAYSSWKGGLLGVLQKQMDAFNDFHDNWYMEELSF